MLKLPTETPSKAYPVRLAPYGAAGFAPDRPSLNLPISRLASGGHRERAEIITRLLQDLRSEMAHPAHAAEPVALDELRRHVALCLLETCLKRELASQSLDGSYCSKNLFELSALGRIMSDLARNDPGEASDFSLGFAEMVRIVAKLFAHSPDTIHVAVDLPKLTLTPMEFRVLMSVGLELASNSVRHAFYHGATGQVSVSLKRTHHGQNVEFCVADDGYGPDRVSMGRGLRLVSRVGAVVGGDIAVRRQPHGGTAVALTFPRARIRPQRRN
jgi:signal transduction histidine kinase